MDQVESEMEQALEELSTALESRGKERKSLAEAPLEQICNIAYRHGLSEDHLDTLTDIIVRPNTLGTSAVDRLIKNLYPAGLISDKIAVKVVGCLGQGVGKPAPSVQDGLLHWMIMTYTVMEDRMVLSSLYGALFNLLDMITIRKPLCHLLATITRRKHVRPFRIQMLLELSRKASNEPSLMGLIRVYKNYYPDVFGSIGPLGKVATFSHPDPEWLAHLHSIQDSSGSKDGGRPMTTRDGFRRGLTKKNKAGAVPEVQTSSATQTSITIEEVDNVDDLVDHLERIELPNQVISVLGDPLLQIYLSIRPSDTIRKRFHHWLVSFFEDELRCIQAGISSQKLSSLLEDLLEYTQFTKV
ncbi:MAG: hsp70 nucleotide exchange factor fes1 [Watsoniomyces obsoletus]|nr:MAG: hsp70 nucleotide exchange factor fes1 [Watsoniomyces obsoletus]